MKYLIIYSEDSFKIVDDSIFIFNSGEEPVAIIKLTAEMIKAIKDSDD